MVTISSCFFFCTGSGLDLLLCGCAIRVSSYNYSRQCSLRALQLLHRACRARTRTAYFVSVVGFLSQPRTVLVVLCTPLRCHTPVAFAEHSRLHCALLGRPTYPRSSQHLALIMGSFLDKPKTEKETHCDHGNGMRAAVSAMQGWRVEMEVRTACRAAASTPHAYVT